MEHRIVTQPGGRAGMALGRVPEADGQWPLVIVQADLLEADVVFWGCV
ncbi:hypothetical protein [Photobacterium ganghwense]|nr:hypothetical protein [Photobacterium ganghwense]